MEADFFVKPASAGTNAGNNSALALKLTLVINNISPGFDTLKGILTATII